MTEQPDEHPVERLDLDEEPDVDVPADVRPPGEHDSELPGDAGNAGDDVTGDGGYENAETSQDQPSQ